ncbi:hypothetical protein BD324DRAFT_618344 [Kockovaella imperatae]|uniref:glucosamine-phosphate N-acetyltransferase n=1 Tax=Kockovaella imperatae TaxID=4999 RepID=A0A1Y1UM35_9TREE|nr:hypothetical protein BD324DRAFT_618344 [Kockovaella imperatae]ORX39052.1 hypothetical protein BD324DRAFT_618344 [Kockovaella imperatae]
MAYAYPSDHPSASSISLLPRGSPGHGPAHSHGHASTPLSRGSSRKGSDDFDVLNEVKVKIEEDETYLQFFQDRIKLEEEYILGLNRLYNRFKAIDTLHEDAFRREEKATIRRAWDEVRDYTQREMQSREAMVGAMREGVVRDLLRLRDEQSRIRQGLKDSIRKSNEMYDDYSRNTLAKLKRNYWQKCQALEDHKRQEHAIAMQAKLLADSANTSPGGTPLREHPNAMSFPISAFSPPTQSAPLPPSSNPAMPEVSFDPSTKESERAAPEKRSGRLRAGSGSGLTGSVDIKGKEMLNDLAQQSKKGFKAMMEKFGGDRDHRSNEDGFVVIPPGGEDLTTIGGGGGGVSASGGSGLQRRGTGARGDPTRGMGTLRGVKVKREADEADKAYRTGVFHLESLRLQREKIHTSGIRNLEDFNDDLNKRLLNSFEAYIDAIQGTAATNAQGTEIVRQTIAKVNLDRDTSLFRTRLKAVDVQRTMPVPYHNYYVGECRSLIFGVSLTDYDFARGDGSDHGRPPIIVEKCIAAIDERGLDAEGIYRISGRHAAVQKMIQDIELDENKHFFDEHEDIYAISNVLKQYLRELPEPIFHLTQSERMKYMENRDSHIATKFGAFRAKLRRMAPIHQTTFQALIEHLKRVADNSAENKMDAKNLQVVFNTVIFGQDQLPPDGNVLAMHLEKETFLEDIISHADVLFSSEEPTLPPSSLSSGSTIAQRGNVHQPADVISDIPGSSRTRIQITKSGGKSKPTSPQVVPQSPFFEGEQPVMPEPTFTPDGELELLFDPTLIPQSLRDAIGDAYHVRPLASTDLMRSHFGLLQTLTQAPPLAPSVYKALFKHLVACPETYFIIVLVDQVTDQLVAHGTLILERKYIHGGSATGHLEDIVVSPNVRGGGIGQKLVVGLKELAMARGAYRVNLGCSQDKIPFYEKCGFYPRSTQMAAFARASDAESNVSPGPPGAVPQPLTSTGLKSPIIRLQTTQPHLASSHLAPHAMLAAGPVIDLSISPDPSVLTPTELGGDTEPSEFGGAGSTYLRPESQQSSHSHTASSESGVTGVTYHYPTSEGRTGTGPGGSTAEGEGEGKGGVEDKVESGPQVIQL